MQARTKNLLLYIVLILCLFLPPIAVVPFPMEESGLVTQEVITTNMNRGANLWLSPRNSVFGYTGVWALETFPPHSINSHFALWANYPTDSSKQAITGDL